MKNLNVKILKMFFITFVVIVVGIFLPQQETKAATNATYLTEGTVYNTRLTGTKKYNVKYTYRLDSYGEVCGLKIYINGKCVKSLKSYDWPEVYLCKVNTKRKLIYVQDSGLSGDLNYIRVYEYKNSELKQLANLATISKTNYAKHLGAAELRTVSSNKMVVRWQVYSAAIGYRFYIDIPYKITSSKITRSGTSYTLKTSDGSSKKLTANKQFKVYTKVGGSKVAFTVKKNQKVTITKLYGKKGVTYIQMKNANGKTGWLKDPNPNTYTGTAYFKNIILAG